MVNADGRTKTTRTDPPRRKNHTETRTDLKDSFKGPDPRPIKVKKPKKGGK